MLIFFFISGGLFLGWSLGANDAANIFGTAVGTKMIKFAKAAIIGSIFVMLGAIVQGSGTTNTLSQLGKVDALGGAFTVALCSAMIVALMTKYKLPVSTGQAIVGSIVSWCYFTSNPVDYSVLSVLIGSWVYGPMLGAIFAALLYLLVRRFIKTTTIHVIKLDKLIRYSLIVVGAFGAYSLGANNIANVMGVFVNSASININIASISFNSVQVLFFLGGLSIALGILTYSKKVMETVGGDILTLTPENAIVVVLAQSLVLFIFSSSSLSALFVSMGLPAIPLVPVSSTQVVVGSVLGIGLVKGVQEIQFKVLGNIALGWVLTPILSGLLTFFSLFFIQNVFDIGITKGLPINDALRNASMSPIVIDISRSEYIYIVFTLVALFIMAGILFLLDYRNRRKAEIANEKKLDKEKEYVKYHKSLIDIEIKNMLDENHKISQMSDLQKKENQKLISHMVEFKEHLQSMLSTGKDPVLQNIEKKEKLENLTGAIQYFIELNTSTDNGTGETRNEFISKLIADHPNLTYQEQRLALLLDAGFSNDEMAHFMNTNRENIKVIRYRLRKKLSLPKETDISEFLKPM
jgi:phosphate/sulfate permease/DNA-binding NarL/FixJ family response regulator